MKSYNAIVSVRCVMVVDICVECKNDMQRLCRGYAGVIHGLYRGYTGAMQRLCRVMQGLYKGYVGVMQ